MNKGDNPFVKLGPNEVCPSGTKISNVKRCRVAAQWAGSMGLHPKRTVRIGSWRSVPFQCSAQVTGDGTLHFSENNLTDNKRFATGEFVMICEKGS